MSNIDKQALREAAELFNSEEGDHWWDEEQLTHEDGLGLNEADGKFIATANPATVLALLDELEAAEKRIAELSQKADIYDMLRQDYELHGSLVDFVDWQAKRIAELEAREVVLPQRYSMLHRVDFDEPYHTEMVYKQHQVLEALHDAGVNVAAAAKGE